MINAVEKRTMGFNLVAKLIGEEATEQLCLCCDKAGRLSVPVVFRRDHIVATIGIKKARTLHDYLSGQRIKISNQKASYMELIIKTCLAANIPEYYLEQSLNLQRDEMRRIMKKVLPTHQ